MSIFSNARHLSAMLNSATSKDGMQLRLAYTASSSDVSDFMVFCVEFPIPAAYHAFAPHFNTNLVGPAQRQSKNREEMTSKYPKQPPSQKDLIQIS